MFGYEMYFAGQKAQHGFELYHHISLLLNANRQVKSIVELGTSMGAMSIYLGLWGVRMGIPVHTFDKDSFALKRQHNIDDGAKPIFDRLDIKCHWGDIFSENGKKTVLDAVGSEPTYLYCDNGKKKDEFYYFVPRIPVGSIVSAHDWPGEIVPADIERAVNDHNLKLEPWDEKSWGTLALATWIKR